MALDNSLVPNFRWAPTWRRVTHRLAVVKSLQSRDTVRVPKIVAMTEATSAIDDIGSNLRT